MLKGQTVILYPTEEQEKMFRKCLGLARFSYNYVKSMDDNRVKEGLIRLSYNEMAKELVKLKKTEGYEWMKELPCDVHKQAALDFAQAKARSKKRVGHQGQTRYKSKKDPIQSFYCEYNKTKVRKGKVFISKIGEVKTSRQMPRGVGLHNPRVIRKGNKWYLSFGIEKAEVKKEILKASIATLEEKLKSAQDADKAAVAAAKDALAAAKAVLANEAATQAEVDAQAQAVQALSQVVTEAKTQAFDKKLEAKKAEEQKAKEATATKEEKEVAAAKKELTQVASEAQVTNTLAKTELAKKDLKVEAKPAVQAAVVKNEEALKVAKELLGNDKATTEQIAKSLAELSNSIKAVYTELENAGAKRNGKFDVVLA